MRIIAPSSSSLPSCRSSLAGSRSMCHQASPSTTLPILSSPPASKSGCASLVVGRLTLFHSLQHPPLLHGPCLFLVFFGLFTCCGFLMIFGSAESGWWINHSCGLSSRLHARMAGLHYSFRGCLLHQLFNVWPVPQVCIGALAWVDALHSLVDISACVMHAGSWGADTLALALPVQQPHRYPDQEMITFELCNALRMLAQSPCPS